MIDSSEGGDNCCRRRISQIIDDDNEEGNDEDDDDFGDDSTSDNEYEVNDNERGHCKQIVGVGVRECDSFLVTCEEGKSVDVVWRQK